MNSDVLNNGRIQRYTKWQKIEFLVRFAMSKRPVWEGWGIGGFGCFEKRPNPKIREVAKRLNSVYILQCQTAILDKGRIQGNSDVIKTAIGER